MKRSISVVAVFAVMLALAACSNKKVSNPIAQVDSKQPDKILFDRAMDAMKHNKFDVARLTLQTLINTYPDSEYVARAKLAVGDSWYAEGGSAALTQAENEYKDFETFFPNMPEAAEAQLKIADIHFHEMEKPDRDFTHALRAEEEYRYLITTWPDSKLVPEAKTRLLEVQEVLAEREYRVGRFYYMRESWNAAVARLQTLSETYPLYSKADETLFLLGTCYQKQAENFRNIPISKSFPETAKARMVKDREDLAAAAFAKIITRYPAMDRVADAQKQLAAMHYPVPKPTAAAIAQSKAEEASRSELGYKARAMDYLHRGPDQALANAVKKGDPTLTDPKQVSAPELITQVNQKMARVIVDSGGGGSEKVSAETVNGPVPNEAPPRSDADPGKPATDSQPAVDQNGIPELKPIQNDSTQPDANQQATPPTQLNEVQSGGDNSAASGSSSSNATAGTNGSGSGDQASQTTPQSSDEYSTNKPKKKKGLRRLNPF